MPRPLVGFRDGRHGQPQRRDAGAGTSAGGQVAGHGEGLGRQGLQSHLATPASEKFPLGVVNAPGVVGEDGLQGLGHALIGGAQGWRCRRLMWNDLKV